MADLIANRRDFRACAQERTEYSLSSLPVPIPTHDGEAAKPQAND